LPGSQLVPLLPFGWPFRRRTTGRPAWDIREGPLGSLAGGGPVSGPVARGGSYDRGALQRLDCMEGSAGLSLADWSPRVLVVCAMDVLAGVWMPGKAPGSVASPALALGRVTSLPCESWPLDVEAALIERCLGPRQDECVPGSKRLGSEARSQPV